MGHEMSGATNDVSVCVNPFVTRLIRFQQDGRDSISGPTNWLEPPLLNVETDTDQEIDSLLDEMCPSPDGTSHRGRWHWLIGSPGNGKSAKVGRVARRLLERDYQIVAEDGLEMGEGGANWLPYVLEVRERGKPFRFAYLVQDASVVRNPFSSDCDPANDLAHILRQATEKGTSLLLCTNWGVLQRLFDTGHTSPEIREESWFSAVDGAISKKENGITVHAGGGRSGGKMVFDEMGVTYEFLDNRSLLTNNDVLERLVMQATAEQNWQACNECSVKAMCPFRANRDDLRTDRIRRNVLEILQRAEVLDGQIIVFREAVALFSLFLAGCPNDSQNLSPCKWVHDQVRESKVFNLIARRIPSIMFGATRPHGLENAVGNHTNVNPYLYEQVSALKSVMDLLEDTASLRDELATVTRPSELSIDIGLERLLGVEGVIPALDPAIDPRHAKQLDDFAAEVAGVLGEAGGEVSIPGVRNIEIHCFRLWENIFDAIAAEGNPVGGQSHYFWARRWQTTCLTWIAAVSDGLTALQPELEEYLEFLDTSGSQQERIRRIMKIEGVLEQLLAPRGQEGNEGARIRLAASLWLTGRWTESELTPRLQYDGAEGSNTLFVEMSTSHTVSITAESFAWLSRQLRLNLSELSFNPDILEMLRRTQAQAAAASDYSVQEENVAIVIMDECDVQHRFDRTRGTLIKQERL